jgi:hypothetical protein
VRTLLLPALLAFVLLLAAPTAALATGIGDPVTGTVAVLAGEATAVETPGVAAPVEVPGAAVPPVVAAEAELPVVAEPVPLPVVEASAAVETPVVEASAAVETPVVVAEVELPVVAAPVPLPAVEASAAVETPVVEASAAVETPGVAAPIEVPGAAVPPVVAAEPALPVVAAPVPLPAVEASAAAERAPGRPSPAAFARAALPAVPEALALPIPAAQRGTPAALRTGVVAQTTSDLDCSAFRFQEDAQGVACETLPSRDWAGLDLIVSLITFPPMPLPSLSAIEAFVPEVVVSAISDLLSSTGLPVPVLAGVTAVLLGAGILLLVAARRRTAYAPGLATAAAWPLGEAAASGS